ncbi:DUF262 domain-containing protein [Sphingobacterium puteale]|uniref:DUF262 domain-containing protein n=1 Tax=Sphingobacterium puteale TaxID=2420510 RepID=UPI003D964F22
MNNEQRFSIKARTCTLKYNQQDPSSIILDDQTGYVIPIYQRPYAWTEDQLRKFIADIFISFWGNDKNAASEPMFIGTMQLSPTKKNETFDIIDGQQRLTSFLLLFKVLQLKYPACEELSRINLNWLSTEVNNKTQQHYLDEFIHKDTLFFDRDSQNPYDRNAFVINKHINEHTSDSEIDDPMAGDFAFDINKFILYLLSSVYFVVIETQAGLSKILQIFNAINTTGLDLNGGDIFKIRMYEYLTSKLGLDQEVFNDISALYKKIDECNTNIGYVFSDMRGILNIYQYILIAKFKLPVGLYNYSSDRFFEHLFDTIIGNQPQEHFKNNVDNLTLSLKDIERIIEVRFEWEKRWKAATDFTLENACAFNFIWMSRYSRYWELAFVVIYRTYQQPGYWENMLNFIVKLNKLFFIYSVRFQKLKGEIYYGLMHHVIDAIVNRSLDDAIRLIDNAIGTEQQHNNGWYDLNFFLTENLTENTKRKNLICRMSSMLHEDYYSNNAKELQEIRKQLFENPIDIEHIQSFHDKDLKKRELIWQEWQENINSLGNLMILEQHYNRSISNSEYKDKAITYAKSKFSIVKNHHDRYSLWDLSKCIERKETEKNRILQYLFN